MQDPELETRLFSLEEAKNTLPLVRPIVKDLVECHQTLKELMDKYKTSDEYEAEDDSSEQDPDLKREIKEKKTELAEYLDEIYTLGAEFQGFDRGWVNFPSRLDNRIVYLCWKPGDEGIQYWHETYSECKERKEIENHTFSGE